MRITYDQGAEGARGGAVEEEGDEQKPNDDNSSVSHPCFHPHKCPCLHHETTTISSEVIAPITCNGHTFTCTSSAAGAGETSTQVEIKKKIERRQIKELIILFSSEKFNPSNYRPLLPPGGVRPRIMEDFISNGGRFNFTIII